MLQERSADKLHTEPDVLTPYAPYESTPLGVVNARGYRPYTLHYGLDKPIANQLFQKSQYPHISNMTRDITKRDGSPGRFSCNETFEGWSSKRRHPFVLLDESRNLSMIVWLGPSNSIPEEFVPEEDKERPRWTYAIRRYEPHKKDEENSRTDNAPSLTAVTSELVVQMVTESYEKEHGTRPLVWLSTTRKNKAALALYKNTGWNEVGSEQLENGDEEVFMIHS